jgi:flagellar basal-body rod protein FlgG
VANIVNTSLYISSGALQAYQQKIDTTANNVANVNTTGYKKRDQSFSEILTTRLNNQVPAQGEVGRLTPNGLRVGQGARVGLTQINMEQGQALQTNNPFDLMINGKGFFQVGLGSTEGAAIDEVRYTRDGNFHLSPNPENPRSYHLVHANGGYLLDQNGNPLQLDDRYEVNIQANGQIQLRNKNGNGNSFVSTQQVGVVNIDNASLLKNMGDNHYAIEVAALPEGTTINDVVTNMLNRDIQLSSGVLEGSNVDLAMEMTDLMTSQRSFQMNARAVSYADQMMGIANSIMR